eukprot:151163_1
MAISDLTDPDSKLFRFELYRVIFLAALSAYNALFGLQWVNQEYARRKFGKQPGIVQKWGRPLLWLSSMFLVISHIDMFHVFEILTEEEVVLLEFHFLLGIFGFLSIYISVMTRSLESAATVKTVRTSKLLVAFYVALLINGYISTILRVTIDQRWTIVYQDIFWIISIWFTIGRLLWAYYSLVKEIRQAHPTRQQQKIKRIESAIRKWKVTVVLVVVFATALTFLRLIPMRGLLGENAFTRIEPIVDFDAQELAFEFSEIFVLTVYLFVVWEPLVLFQKARAPVGDSTVGEEFAVHGDIELSFSEELSGDEYSVSSAELPAEEYSVSALPSEAGVTEITRTETV